MNRFALCGFAGIMVGSSAQAVVPTFSVRSVVELANPATFYGATMNDLGDVAYNIGTSNTTAQGSVWSDGVSRVIYGPETIGFRIRSINNVQGLVGSYFYPITEGFQISARHYYMDGYNSFPMTYTIGENQAWPPWSNSHEFQKLMDDGSFVENFTSSSINRSSSSARFWTLATGFVNITTGDSEAFSMSQDHRIAFHRVNPTGPSEPFFYIFDANTHQSTMVASHPQGFLTRNGTLYKFGATNVRVNPDGSEHLIPNLPESWGLLNNSGWTYSGLNFWEESSSLVPFQSLLAPSSTGWNITEISELNESGQYLGRATFGGTEHLVLLTPTVPEPSSLLALSLGATGLLRRRRRPRLVSSNELGEQ